MTAPDPDLAQLVDAWSAGDAEALESLVKLVYPELRAIAHRQLRGERSDHTLSTTALVHEAYLNLAGHAAPEWQGRAQFFALLSRIMRHVLLDHARARATAKRGHGLIRVPLRPEAAVEDEGTIELIALDQALARLAEKSERMAQVVECRFFGGLNEAEIADALGISERTVMRDWKRARAYLFHWLAVNGDEASGDAQAAGMPESDE